MKSHEVIIVGAGPAGSSLAIRLARAGVDTLLVEKARFPRDKVCGELINPRAIRSLDALGCVAEIRARGYPEVRDCAVALDGRITSRGALPKVPGCEDYAHFVPRIELDEIIFRRAQEAGAATLEDCRVQGFSLTADGVEVHGLSDDDQPVTLRGRLLVGADGADSTVARSAGLKMDDDRHVGLAMRAYGQGYPLREPVLYFDRDYFPGLGWVFPLKDGRFNIGLGLTAETVKRNRLKLKGYFERLTGYVEEMAAAEGYRPTIDPPAGWALKSYGGARANYFERGLLIGDAGCFADPLTGEGIPVALETAEMASEILQQALAEERYDAEYLSEYERRFRDRYDLDCQIADVIHTVARNRHCKDLWMTALRAMNETGNRDEAYALKAAGIYCGIVPLSEALEPGFFMSPLLQWPQTWRDVLDISAERPLADLAQRTIEGIGWSMSAMRGMLEDPEWSREWFQELTEKQLKLMRSLAERGLGGLG